MTIATLSDFGRYLKNLREQQELTLNEMESKYGLRSEIIFLLEKGDPVGMVFARHILLKYQEVFQPKENLETLYTALLAKHDTYPHVTLSDLHFLSFRFFFFVFACMLALYFGLSLAGSLLPPKVYVLNFPQDTLTVARPQYTLTVKVDPPDATVSLNKEEYYPNKEGFVEKDFVLNPGMNEITITVTNRLGRVTTLTKKILLQEQQ